MIPHVKNVILASSDQVAIDAVAAKLMGFDPLRDLKYVRLAHEAGLGCGDPREIEIVGDQEAAAMNWRFDGPFKKMTFASRMQHHIYWVKLKKPIEWSLKTWLAPWAYIASVLYHDSYWYPFKGRDSVGAALRSDWGLLFNNWETLTPDDRGWPEVGVTPLRDPVRKPGRLLRMSLNILGQCITQAPEFLHRKKRGVSKAPERSAPPEKRT